MPEYFHAAYIFGCKRNTAISANKPKYTFLLLTSVVAQRATPISDPISQNQLPLFSRPPSRVPSTAKQTVSSLKSDCALFSQLFIAFFKHENHAYPPLLSQLGKLRFGTKSDLVECLEKLCTLCGEPPPVDFIILDGAANTIINMLKPMLVSKLSKNMQHSSFFLTSNRYWETWQEWMSFGMCTWKWVSSPLHERSEERVFEGELQHPTQYLETGRLDDNKTELFKNLGTPGKLPVWHILFWEQCTCVYTLQIHQWSRECSFMPSAVLLENTELWVAFGTGKLLRYIPAHDIATALGDEKARSLPMFHAFTGCDTVSSFAGRHLEILQWSHSSISEAYMSVLECYCMTEPAQQLVLSTGTTHNNGCIPRWACVGTDKCP